MVKLVLQQSDKQLESIHKQLSTSAMGLASQLTSISTIMNEISAAFKESKPDEQGDRAKMARDWKDISKASYSLLCILFFLILNVEFRNTLRVCSKYAPQPFPEPQLSTVRINDMFDYCKCYERYITDFLGEFSGYMCSAEENVNLKREEARLYSEVSSFVS